MKILIIKKGEYDIWSMRMRQYICHTDYNLWDIIVDGDLQEEAATAGEQYGPPAPKTAKRNQERVKSILLLAIPDEYLLKFHNVPDAKSLWAAIKSSLDKAYDRFQKLISQLEVHAAPVSKEDINQKFLRSLPPSWSQIALIMRNKPDIDQTDIDDLYNNLRVYEDEMKRSLSSTSNSQNLAFLSSENTSSTNEVSTASGNFRVNTARGTSSTSQVSSTLGADEVIDQDDLEELDIRWQVAMLTVRVQRFIQKILSIGIQNLEVEYSLKGVCLVEQNYQWEKKTYVGMMIDLFEYSIAVAIAFSQKIKEVYECEGMFEQASTRVRFCLSTTTFCSGVRGSEVVCSIPSSLKEALSVLLDSVPLSVRLNITGLEDFVGSIVRIFFKTSGCLFWNVKECPGIFGVVIDNYSYFLSHFDASNRMGPHSPCEANSPHLLNLEQSLP
ncbi:hypothetical protein Tco_1354528 [Tanacetum coccineum]